MDRLGTLGHLYEFERLGGVPTIRVNIRLIAAANRDLAKSVAAREFRSDLYYRLHVVPVHMPPLRERGKDIEVLVRYFVQKFSHQMKKRTETIPTETMNALTRWGVARKCKGVGEFYREIGDSLRGDDSQCSVVRVETGLRGGSPRCHLGRSGTGAHPSRAARKRRSDCRFARGCGPAGYEAHHSSVQNANAEDGDLPQRV